MAFLKLSSFAATPLRRSMCTGPVLNYFGIRGRGEPIRMTFAACDAPYQLNVIGLAGKEREAMKGDAGTAASPCGQLPTLDYEGVTLHQMCSIMQHVASSSNPTLAGDTALERATVDALLHTVDDLYLKYISAVYGSELSSDSVAELWQNHFNSESKSEKNGGAHMFFLAGALSRSSGPFLVGDRLTVADIFFYYAIECFSRDGCFGPSLFEEYPILEPYFEAVASSNNGLTARLQDPARASLPLNANGQG